MSFESLETLPIARSLAQIADRDDDVAEVYLEEVEEVTVDDRLQGAALEVRREAGFAVRLVRDGECWVAARDGFGGDSFGDALREAARALPMATYTVPELRVAPSMEPADVEEVLIFADRVRDVVQARLVAFPMRFRTRRHRRNLQIVGTRLVPDPEFESFYSCRVALPWGVYGALLPELDESAVHRVANSLVAAFRGRKAAPIAPGACPVVLGPAATAVFLHEAVAHALETDTLSLGGSAEAAIGVELGSSELNVLDDPGGAPAGVRRSTDDEGMPVLRRWLLLEGRVKQPLADLHAARASGALAPGAARRADRYSAPVPRSSHLELLSGGHSTEELLVSAEGGLFLPEASSGALNPHSGEFRIRLPYGFRISDGGLGELVGPLEIHGRVAELLAAVSGVGDAPESSGAGWCAKGGQRLAVWSTTPALALSRAEVTP